MQSVYTYQIEVQGQVDVRVLNANSPLRIFSTRSEVDSTTLAVKTDQSGLIGLLRHLHGQGFVFLSFCRGK